MKSTHFDQSGRARMVEVSEKHDTLRIAIARGTVKMNKNTVRMIREGAVGKGDVLAVACTAGIMAAKRTWELIPMCHNIRLTGACISFKLAETEVQIEAEARAFARTGAEMEAMTAVSVAALTIYDMCKSIERGIIITDIKLVKKSGGKSGEYIAGEHKNEG